MLRAGGNAMDAAAAMGFALNVLEPHQNGFGGEVPTLVRSAADGQIYAVSGHGTAPAAATIDRYRSLGVEDLIPGDGFLPAVVPPTPATWIAVLDRFGTMRLADVLAPALELAEHGFPMYDSLYETIRAQVDRFRAQWPASAAKFLPGGQPPPIGAVWKQPDLAATFRKLIDAESECKDRSDGLRAAHERFYCGDIARQIVQFASSTPVRDALGHEHVALLTRDDLAGFSARIEDPVSVDYKGLQVYKCSSWTQGPVLLQSLRLLEDYDLKGMGHNSADYIHTVVECMKLAYADREFYYGDPAFADVPFDRLLSREYAADRRRLVDPAQASMSLRPGGYDPISAEKFADVLRAFGWAPSSGPADGDTTKLDVVDADGNMVSATPSGGWLMSSPIIPGLGFCLGTRGQMFSMVEGHPNSLEPGKRPRSTLTPSIVTQDGRPYMAFGSPGGDCQDQWALQFFLNVVEFGMSLQEAAEAPAFNSAHFPGSFYPRTARPGVLRCEDRIPDEVREDLSMRGHIVEVQGGWSGQNVQVVAMDADSGVISAGASPRRDSAYCLGW